MRFCPPIAIALLACLFACAQGTLRDPDAGERCGDGVRQTPEECDKGEQNGPNAGCERDCTLSCVPSDKDRGDAHCDPHDPCKGTGTCGADFACHLSGALAPGAPCGDGKICRDGACQAAVCGDGVVEAGEECDDGVNDGAHGCDSNCHFVCVSADSTRNCAPADMCQGGSSCNDTTHMCSTRTPLANGTDCGGGKVCRQGQCLSNLCGNGTVDTGEQCDPPNGTTCDSNCQNIVCGDGVRAGQEQCDDGNLVNLDGCDSHCKFEQDLRANAVTMLYGTDTYCTANALGGAVGSQAQSPLQSSINADIKAGVMSMGFQFLGLTDLSGTNASGFKIGGVNGTPYPAPSGKTYDGASDLDWWYTSKASDLDSNRLPLLQLSGAISSKALTAGPGKLNITFVFGGGPVQLKGSNVKLKASVGATSAPTLVALPPPPAPPSAGTTPGHTPAEHLDHALVSFASLANGELCGNISAKSLNDAPAPTSLISGGANACDEGYTSSNHLLDIIVNGCTNYGFITIIAPTNPDQADASMTVAGAGAPYKLTYSGGKISACKDKNGAAVTLATCLDAAAYSSGMKFTADRVILK